MAAPTMRVLTRPPTPAPSLPRPPTPDPLSSSQGVVVVGFISRRPDYSGHLINRMLDSNAFGSGNLDKTLRVDSDEVKDWFKFRRISYYHEQERGIVYLQFCSKHCPVVHGSSSVGSGFDSAVEEHEFGDLQGMLFMFSACHIIIYIQEGSRFNTQTLKNFRLLQAAKHAFAPVVRSQPPPPSQSRSRSSSSSRPTTSMNSSTNTSPGRSGTMSGLGSFLPGQYTPVTLFVFIDEFLDAASASSNLDETTDVSLLSRPNLPAKGPGSVVVLARPVNKSEISFKKKLQSSLEAQIRFLIKKCRTLSSPETSGPRSGVISSSAPLFSLDASRVAVLLDRLTNQRGESLEFAISLVEEVLNGKATPDSLLLERHSQSPNKEDINILSIKEYIYRQCDALRGKGGLVAAGVGMVAVAAAAGAASVASGKATAASVASGKATAELPNLDLWISSSEAVLQGILTAKRGCLEESDIIRRRPRRRHVSPPQAEATAEPLDIAVSWLERGKGLNTKFSTLWCQKALPSAKDVYLKNLPTCYPTSEHKIHLEKALHAFHSMVKGPSVPEFAKTLEDECTSIWKSGRQQCDAISLTRKPCMHQIHDIENGDPHSSGYVFLHACACGRSRRLREDPFDFKSANLTDCFSDCDNLLPALQLPEITSAGPIKPSAWRLMRVGSTRYYEPSKGLLQSGCSATELFLKKWVIYLEKKEAMDSFPTQPEIIEISDINTKMEPNSTLGVKKNYAATLYSSGDSLPRSENSRQTDNVGGSDNRNISFGRGLHNFTVKKAFSEVVAGSAATNSEFPPLQLRKPSEKLTNRNGAIGSRAVEQVHMTSDHRKESTRKLQEISSDQEQRKPPNGFQSGDPILRIGSNIIPVNNTGAAEKMKPKTSLKHVVAYVGFEHECPHGHRFLLNTKYLNELGSFYASSECGVSSPDSGLASSQVASLRMGEIDKVHLGSLGIASGKKKLKNTIKSRGMMVNGNVLPNASDPVKNVEEGCSSISLDDGALLNRNLPLYMNCPHCKRSKTDDAPSNVKLAGTISQLQRIFVVTPPFPVTLAASPIVQFEATCLPSLVAKEKLQFGLGSQQVVLPAESFIVLKLPFVYGAQLEEDSTTIHPLNPFDHQPELTAWICKGTALLVVSKEKGLDNGK